MNKKYNDLPLRSDPNYMKEWVKKNKEKIKTYTKTYNDSLSPKRKSEISAKKIAYAKVYYSNEKNRIKRIEKQWNKRGILNLDWDIYEKTLLEQNNNCQICKEKMTKPQADHNHKTGNFRALLCSGCNLSLGRYEKFKKQFDNYIRKYND